MSGSSKRILFIFLSLALFASSAFVYSTWVKDAYQKISSLRSDLTSKTDSFIKTQETINRVQSLLRNLQNANEVQKRASLILPIGKDPGYLVNQISGLAKVNGLELESLSTQLAPLQPSRSSIVRNVGRLKADVRLKGSYAGFKSFLRNLENNIFILDVNNLRIESNQVKGELSSLSYSLSITSYYQVE